MRARTGLLVGIVGSFTLFGCAPPGSASPPTATSEASVEVLGSVTQSPEPTGAAGDTANTVDVGGAANTAGTANVADTSEPAPVESSSDTETISPPLRIAVAGDVGTGGSDELATAQAMDRLEGDDDYRALLLLGDNVYDDGDPSELERTVFGPFADVLDHGTELIPVLGNHDVDDGFGDAQTVAIGMPAAWYATQLSDDVLVVALESNRWDDPNQIDFLERTLASATATWKIAIMHHPPYSGGWHGSDLDVRAAFSPLFEKYGVQLVLTGHDHDYQRSEEINGVTYVVSGGAALLRPTAVGESMVVAESTYHFVDLAVVGDHIDLRAVDQAGEIIDEATIDA